MTMAAAYTPLVDSAHAHPYLTLVALLLAVHAAHSFISLLHNIRLARATGLPYLIYPYSFSNPLLVLLVSWPWVQNLIATILPQLGQDYIFQTMYSTHWRVQGRWNQRLGAVFLAVSPTRITAFVADAGAIREIMADRERFPKSLEQYQTLNMYGPNLVASEGEQWAHHKKFITSPFGERNYKLVWRVALQQARELLGTWNTDMPDVQNDLFRQALHTFSEAIYGIPMSFSTELREGEDSESLGFQKALTVITTNLLPHAISISVLPHWLRPKRHADAHTNFERFLKGMVQNADKGGSSLLSLLVDGEGLTDQEIMGNLFVFTVAGHETTAQSMYFAMVTMALMPEVQDWVREEVDRVLGAQESQRIEDWRYEDVFPKLGRVLFLMLETLRIYALIPYIPKSCTYPTTLTVGGKAHPLPPMDISLSTASLHLSPLYWGPTASSFDPTRWDASNTSSFLAKNRGAQGLQVAGLEFPNIHRPERGAFVAFSDGARGCIGRKFGQVLFVATITMVLRGWEVGIKCGEGETREMARERVRGVISRSSATVALGVREEVGLVLTRRGA
ncbi:cytochrome P450 [Sphaerosporella brunnea]|uniref:Cytochrome P450 n=1 Tax=Sphaerosporella brunnea TaxID=1250544 RepID=A0A5J5EQ97_9PEZI|nr:cytochrome P450 [Sphaerosporella brunnea]